MVPLEREISITAALCSPHNILRNHAHVLFQLVSLNSLDRSRIGGVLQGCCDAAAMPKECIPLIGFCFGPTRTMACDSPLKLKVPFEAVIFAAGGLEC